MLLRYAFHFLCISGFKRRLKNLELFKGHCVLQVRQRVNLSQGLNGNVSSGLMMSDACVGAHAPEIKGGRYNCGATDHLKSARDLEGARTTHQLILKRKENQKRRPRCLQGFKHQVLRSG